MFKNTDTDFASSKVLKRFLTCAILLHEFLRLSCAFLITMVETKPTGFGLFTWDITGVAAF
jgi:hypothetical protein